MSGAGEIGEEVRAAMRTLGYDERWILYGFITPELVLRQHSDHLTGDPYCRGTGHLRLHALQAWRLYRVFFTDEEVERFLELAAADPDPVMATSEVIALLSDPGLTDAQFERVAGAAARRGVPAARIERERFDRKRHRGEVGEDDLRRAVEAHDGALHDMLLSGLHVPRWVVERLAEEGANKSVRNRAGQMLRSRRWESGVDGEERNGVTEP